MSNEKVDIDKELLPFLSPSARHDLKFFAIQYFVGLSGTVSGRQFITSKQIYIDRVVELANDNVTNVVKEAIACLINIAGDDHGIKCILNSTMCDDLLDSLLDSVVQRGCLLADALAMLLSNITRIPEAANKVLKILTKSDPPTTLDTLVQVLCFVGYNKHADLHFLAPFLANLSQILEARQYFLDKERCVIQKLLPFTQHESDIRRQAVSTILKNCCFETEYHEWLLSPTVDIVPSLLMPLAGPEEFDDDDMEKLPTELQYLEPDKAREKIPLVRANLVEALIQLCATQTGRKYMKEHNVYVIMREYHKWEKESKNENIILNLIDILIGDEPVDSLSTNLKEIEIPDHLQKQFEEDEKAELTEAPADN